MSSTKPEDEMIRPKKVIPNQNQIFSPKLKKPAGGCFPPNIPPTTITLHRGKIKSVKKIRTANAEYVYDIGMKNESKPWYFGNNILIHNSCYFSAWPAVKDDVEAGRLEWDTDVAIQLYDTIADQVNDSFPAMMERSFHVPRDMGSVIKCGRELVASSGLFIKKKRYAVLIVDMEGKRLDVDGKPGKVKAMGLDLKRSDTPKVVQDFLSDILYDVLTGCEKEQIYEKVVAFKYLFHDRPSWEKGTPKRVNNLTKYTALEVKQGKANMPGHVRAAMNWNNLKRMYGDNYSTSVVDGMKTIVCKLKPNPMGLTSVGYPTDETHLPQWYKDLPFDDSLMESTIVNQKVENLLSVLNWRIPENPPI